MNQGQIDPARAARFEALVHRVHEPLVRYTRRRVDPDTADEAVAETLAVLWRRLDDIPTDAELAWCYGVARHCVANARRGNMRRLRLASKAMALADRGASVVPEVDISPNDEDPELARALARLEPPDREILRLWAWEQLETRDLAAVLGITPNAASIRLHRAKQRLKNLLAPESPATQPDTFGVEDRKEAP